MKEPQGRFLNRSQWQQLTHGKLLECQGSIAKAAEAEAKLQGAKAEAAEAKAKAEADIAAAKAEARAVELQGLIDQIRLCEAFLRLAPLPEERLRSMSVSN